jgi:hypothetical protein
LNTAYAYLAEQAEAADAVALPAYRVAQLKEDEIHANSRRTALDSWLEAPMGRTAEREDALVRFLTS